MSARCRNSSRGRAPTIRRRLAREHALIERPEAGDCIRPPAYDQGVVEPSSKPSWRPAAAMKRNGLGAYDQGGLKPSSKPSCRPAAAMKGNGLGAYDQGDLKPEAKPSRRPAAGMRGNGQGEDDQGDFKPEPKPTRRGERVIKRPPRGQTYPGWVIRTLVINVPPNNEQTNTRATTHLDHTYIHRTNLHQKRKFFFSVSARFTVRWVLRFFYLVALKGRALIT